jgi:hypothetical protein
MSNPTKAAFPCLKRAHKCDALSLVIGRMRRGETLQTNMPKCRAILAELTQRIHEYSAYRNASDT